MIVKIDFTEIASEMLIDFEETDLSFDMGLSESETQIDMDFGEITEVPAGDIETFDGPYAVRPALVDQTLETEGLLMRQDVTVEQIPIYIVSNNSGGNTVVIGG